MAMWLASGSLWQCMHRAYCYSGATCCACAGLNCFVLETALRWLVAAIAAAGSLLVGVAAGSAPVALKLLHGAAVLSTSKSWPYLWFDLTGLCAAMRAGCCEVCQTHAAAGMIALTVLVSG
jgi:hypothetical protein